MICLVCYVGARCTSEPSNNNNTNNNTNNANRRIVPVAAVAGATAAAAYLDAKYHIRKDLTTLYNLKHQEKFVIKEGIYINPLICICTKLTSYTSRRRPLLPLLPIRSTSQPHPIPCRMPLVAHRNLHLVPNLRPNMSLRPVLPLTRCPTP